VRWADDPGTGPAKPIGHELKVLDKLPAPTAADVSESGKSTQEGTEEEEKGGATVHMSTDDLVNAQEEAVILLNIII